jgi:hypothetical protein
VLVATDAGGAVFRMVGSEARLAWSGGGGAWIKMLKLSVDNGNVVPVAPTIVYSTSWLPVAVGGLDWSPDGQTLYFADEVGTVDGRWVDSVKAINVASCVTDCPVQTIYTFPDDNGVGPLRVNAAGNRLYMSIHDRVPNIRTVSFLERQGSTWSSPLLRHVVSNQDSAYVSVDGLAGAEVGRWDHNNSSILSDVVMYVVERPSGNTIDIVDVSNCTASGVSTCLSSGESSVVRSGLALSAATFTTTPGWSASAPSLLVPTGSWADNTELVSEFDLGSMTFTPLVVGASPDSAD